MPSVAVKLYSILFKILLKHRLQNLPLTSSESNPFGITSRPEESISAANPSFNDGVATKDIHIDPSTSLSIRIFLPDSALTPPEQNQNPRSKIPPKGNFYKPRPKRFDLEARSGKFGGENGNLNGGPTRRYSFGPSGEESSRRNGFGGGYGYDDVEGLNLMTSGGVYRGYSPEIDNRRKLPVMLQFHGGGWVSGSNDSVANDFFCRRIAKVCDVIVIGVGYRLAPESKYPAAFEDGMKVLNWLTKQANLAECSKSLGLKRGSGTEFKKPDAHRHIVDSFGASVVEPWLAAHADPSRLHFLSLLPLI